MRNKMLSVCDREETYVRRLAQLLCLRDSFPFQVATYTESAQMTEAKKLKGTDVLLISVPEYEKLNGQETWKKEMEHIVVILLDDGMHEVPAGVPSIYKFQSGEIIRKELLEIYGCNIGDGVQNSTGHKHTKILGVYTPVGRCGQTSFCLLLGQMLSKEHKVLYLNFEAYSGFSGLIDRKEEKDMTDLIFSLHGDGSKLGYQMESMVCNLQGLDYINPSNSFLDLASITADNWIILLEALKSAGNYDYVILDLSEMVQGLMEVLRACHLIYTITKKDGFACHKMTQYEMILRSGEYEDVLLKTKKCEFPVFRNLPDGLEELPYSEMAGYIRQMIREEPEFQGGVF